MVLPRTSHVVRGTSASVRLSAEKNAYYNVNDVGAFSVQLLFPQLT